MIKYLQQEYNIKPIESPQMKELIDLRKQVEQYRKKFDEKDEEMVVSSESEPEVNAEEQKKIDEELKKRSQKKKNFRVSVSAEVYGFHNIKKPFIPRVIPKTEEQKKRITERCLQSFLFNSLEDKELKTVIDSFEEKNIKRVKM